MAEKTYKGGACPGLPCGLTVKAERGEFSLFLGETLIAWGKMSDDRGDMIWRVHRCLASNAVQVNAIISRLADYTNGRRAIRVEKQREKKLLRAMDDQRARDEKFSKWLQEQK